MRHRLASKTGMPPPSPRGQTKPSNSARAVGADARFCTVISRRTQAIISIGRGDLAAAERALAEALGAAAEHDMRIELCRVIEVAALVSEARGQNEEAARIWGGAQPYRDQIGLARNLNPRTASASLGSGMSREVDPVCGMAVETTVAATPG